MSAAIRPRAPLAVYMLADHLDAALAAAEDLIARGRSWRALAEAPGDDPAGFAFAQRRIAEDVRSFELMLVARMLKAREHARTLGASDRRFAPLAKLFASGAASLLDAVAECGDARREDFDSGDGLTAYLRSRGLIPTDAARVELPQDLNFDDGFLVARRVALGTLRDMAASFLDALEAHYDLFVDETEGDGDGPTPDRGAVDGRDRISLDLKV